MLYRRYDSFVYHILEGKKCKCGAGADLWEGEALNVEDLLRYKYVRSCKRCFGTKAMVLAVSLAWSDGGHSLMTLQNGILNWSWYTTNVGTYDPKIHNIEHVYGLVDLYDSAETERIEIVHVNRYPPEQGTGDNGWLLPDGSFWPTSPENHYSEAEYLYRYLYQKNAEYSSINFGVYLENELGWIKIQKDIVMSKKTPTKEQIERLLELAAQSESDMFKQLVRWEVEKYEDEQNSRAY